MSINVTGGAEQDEARAAEIEAAIAAERERCAKEADKLRRALELLLEMPSACTTDAEVIENNRRRELARAAMEK